MEGAGCLQLPGCTHLSSHTGNGPYKRWCGAGGGSPGEGTIHPKALLGADLGLLRPRVPNNGCPRHSGWAGASVLQHLLRARRSVQLWVQKPDGWIWGVGVTAKPRGKL